MHIRPVTTLEECRQVTALERAVWGYTDAEDIVPAPVLIVSIKPSALKVPAISFPLMIAIYLSGYFSHNFFQFAAICLLCSIISGGTCRNGGRSGPA